MAEYTYDYSANLPQTKVKLDGLWYEPYCLIDSGAVISIFPKFIGTSMGIDFSELELMDNKPIGLTGKAQ